MSYHSLNPALSEVWQDVV